MEVFPGEFRQAFDFLQTLAAFGFWNLNKNKGITIINNPVVEIK